MNQTRHERLAVDLRESLLFFRNRLGVGKAPIKIHRILLLLKVYSLQRHKHSSHATKAGNKKKRPHTLDHHDQVKMTHQLREFAVQAINNAILLLQLRKLYARDFLSVLEDSRRKQQNNMSFGRASHKIGFYSEKREKKIKPNMTWGCWIIIGDRHRCFRVNVSALCDGILKRNRRRQKNICAWNIWAKHELST